MISATFERLAESRGGGFPQSRAVAPAPDCEKRRGLAADRAEAAQAAAAVAACEHLTSARDEIQAIRLGPGEEADRIAQPSPTPPMVGGLEQAVHRRRDEATTVTRVDDEVDQWTGLLKLAPAAAAVGAREQPVVRGVVSLDELVGEPQG